MENKKMNKNKKIVLLSLLMLIMISVVIVLVMLLTRKTEKTLSLTLSVQNNTNEIIVNENDNKISITFTSANEIKIDEVFVPNHGEIVLKKNDVDTDSKILFNNKNKDDDRYEVIITYKSQTKNYVVELDFSRVIDVLREDTLLGYVFKSNLGLIERNDLENISDEKFDFYLDKELNKLIDYDLAITVDKIYAKIPSTYIVITLDFNQGEFEKTSITIEKGSKLGNALPTTSINNPKYFAFDNWYLSSGVLVDSEAIFNDDAIIIASWESDRFKYEKETLESTWTISQKMVLNYANEDFIIPNQLYKGMNVVNVGKFVNTKIGGPELKKLIIPKGFIRILSQTFIGLAQASNYDLEISNTLEIIDKEAFMSSNVNAVSFEENSSLKVIEEMAFAYSNITVISLPESLTRIGKKAFQNTTKLNIGLNIGNALELIDEEAFYGSKISGINFLDVYNSKLETIGDSAFYGVVELTGTLELPINLKEIGFGAFCVTGLNELVTFPGNKLVKIGQDAFGFNANLTSELHIGNMLEEIGIEAFYQNQLTKIIYDDIENSVLRSIGNFAFLGNKISGILMIPSSLTHLGKNSFAHNEIEELIISDNSLLTTIEESAFTQNKLTKIEFGQNSALTTIDQGAFRGISTIIEEVVIPNSVRFIKSQAFYDSKIGELIFYLEAPSLSIDSDAFGDVVFTNPNVKLPTNTTMHMNAFLGSNVNLV